MIPRVWSFMKFYPFNKFLKICIKKISFPMFYFLQIRMKNLKLLLIHWSLAIWLSIYAIYWYMLWCDRSLPRCPELQCGNTLLEVLNSNMLVTSTEPTDGCYCWLLCITICIHLSTTESYTPENCCNYSKLYALRCLFRCCGSIYIV
jgi:hypothetical protein